MSIEYTHIIKDVCATARYVCVRVYCRRLIGGFSTIVDQLRCKESS